MCDGRASPTTLASSWDGLIEYIINHGLSIDQAKNISNIDMQNLIKLVKHASFKSLV